MTCQLSQVRRDFPQIGIALLAIFFLSACPLEPIPQPPIPDVGPDIVDDLGPEDTYVEDVGGDVGSDVPDLQDEGPDDAGSTPPLFNSDSRALWAMEFSSGSADWCHALGNEDVLIKQGDDLHWMGSPGDVILTLAEGLLAGDVVAADQNGLGHLVVATDNAIYVSSGDELVLSPLSEALAGTTITDLTIARRFDGDVIWIATSDGIHRWENDLVQSLDLGDVPSTDVQLAWGAPLNSGLPSLWVNAGSHVYAITHNGTAATAWVEQSDVDVSSITIDGSGRLWMETSEGLELRDSDGIWYPEPLEFEVDQFSAHRDRAGTFALGSDGFYRHILGQTAWKILDDGEPPGPALCTDGLGRLITDNTSGLVRYHPWEDISTAGLTNGGTIEADLDSSASEVSITLSYLPETAEPVSAADVGLSAELNGEALDLGEAPFSLSFDPWLLDSGDYILTLRRSIVGDQPWDLPTEGEAIVEQSVYFSSERPLVTWSNDIEALHTDSCNACHGQAGQLANDLKFYNYSQWRERFHVIVSMVESQLMPPGAPLSPEQILLLKYWGLAQFQE